jgi:hypothetical protein
MCYPELETQSPNSAFDVVKGGNAAGMYAHKQLGIMILMFLTSKSKTLEGVDALGW